MGHRHAPGAHGRVVRRRGASRAGDTITMAWSEHGEAELRVVRGSRRTSSPTAGTRTTPASATPSSSSPRPRAPAARLKVVERLGRAAHERRAPGRAARRQRRRLEGGARRPRALRADRHRVTEDVFAALADPTRRTILDLLATHGHGTATTLAAELPVSRPAVIKHLAVLDRAGLVAAQRHGREVRYRPARTLQATAAWMSRLAADWDARLAAVKRLAEDAAGSPDERDELEHEEEEAWDREDPEAVGGGEDRERRREAGASAPCAFFAGRGSSALRELYPGYHPRVTRLLAPPHAPPARRARPRRDKTRRRETAERQSRGRQVSLLLEPPPRQRRREPAHAHGQAAARVPPQVQHAVRGARDRPLQGDNRRDHPVGGVQARDRRERDARRGRRRVVVADEHRRRRRRQLRPVPAEATVPLLPRVREGQHRVQRGLLRRDHRAYYDGKMPWLNDVERGTDYKPGDLYGSLGAWFAGRWHTQPANDYIQRVKDTLKARTWRSRDFQGQD